MQYEIETIEEVSEACCTSSKLGRNRRSDSCCGSGGKPGGKQSRLDYGY